MYAVIEDSGTQIKVSQGDVIKVDLRDLPDDTTTITFDKVLFVSDEQQGAPKIGQPLVAGAKVMAEVLSQERTPRLVVVKFKRRKTYTRRKGHRQGYLKVKVTSIEA